MRKMDLMQDVRGDDGTSNHANYPHEPQGHRMNGYYGGARLMGVKGPDMSHMASPPSGASPMSRLINEAEDMLGETIKLETTPVRPVAHGGINRRYDGLDATQVAHVA